MRTAWGLWRGGKAVPLPPCVLPRLFNIILKQYPTVSNIPLIYFLVQMKHVLFPQVAALAFLAALQNCFPPPPPLMFTV